MKNLLSIIILFFIFSGCQKKKIEEQSKTDNAIILKYIADHKLNASSTNSGIYYIVNKMGNGTYPNSNSQVKVAYKGYFTDGSVFDQSENVGIIFGLQEVIKGWTEGIPYFSEGGSGTLLIPSSLGYGSKGTSGIPENSVLIFDINLIAVY
jgi:FKBP-type peptidyl-prolyl cis-trans isomerase FkpA